MSSYWSLNINKQGQTVLDLDDIEQSINIILTTIKGSDPLRPDFGCSLFEYIGKPVNYAIPNIVREIGLSLEKFEPRITLNEINYKLLEGSNALFEIHWTANLNSRGTSSSLAGSTDSNVTTFLLTEESFYLGTEDSIKFSI